MYVGPRNQAFSWRSLASDLLQQTADVIEEFKWFPTIAARHLKAAEKYKAGLVRTQAKASAQLETLKGVPDEWQTDTAATVDPQARRQ
jgi:hypothetical protein